MEKEVYSGKEGYILGRLKVGILWEEGVNSGIRKTPHIITKGGGVDREMEGYILGGSNIDV